MASLSKLTTNQIKEIKEKYRDRVSLTILAKEYGVDRKTIYYHLGRELNEPIHSPKKYLKKLIAEKPKSYKQRLAEAREREIKKHGFITW